MTARRLTTLPATRAPCLRRFRPATTSGRCSRTPRFVIPTPRRPPTANMLAFQSNRDKTNQIWLLPWRRSAAQADVGARFLAGAGRSKIGTRVMTPTWAPDSKSLLYISTRSGPYNIYSIPVEGGRRRRSRTLPEASGSRSTRRTAPRSAFPPAASSRIRSTDSTST